MIDVFVAVADPTRRGILDRLQAEGPQSIKRLTAPLDMTRQAVTKHLDVLEQAGLVRREMRGREAVCRLVADRLRVVDEWLDRYSAEWDRRLERLRTHVEGTHVEGTRETRDRSEEDDDG
jgi:DNA-binding transcriptional ArsR family regulator